MSVSTSRNYLRLHRFMSNWFHQDFDLVAPNWEGVVDAFRAASEPIDRAALRGEIAAFIAECANDPAVVERRFQAAFAPEVLPTHFAETTLAFLQAVHARLGADDPRPCGGSGESP